MRGPETEKSHQRRVREGFYDKYMQGMGLDIGFRGHIPDAIPILPTAIGIERDYPGYDGKTLPFPDESQDYVYTSHCLEHIEDYKTAIQEWWRVLKVGGFLIITVPHQFLYEKKMHLPSRYNGDHKRFYCPNDLLFEIYDSLSPNSYRIRHCCDNDEGFDYSIPPVIHSCGEYQIEVVVQKIKMPTWEIK